MSREVADLRFGYAPTIDPAPGIDPKSEALAMLAPGTPSPAKAPIPGKIVFYGDDSGCRRVLRIPRDWNGCLVVAGTPGTRIEYANDAIWSDFALARGYAFASSNKGIPYNTIVETASDAHSTQAAYPIPFDAQELERKQTAFRPGVLNPKPIPISAWNEDFRRLIEFARLTLQVEANALPRRTYLVGLSNGGAQVRTALERFPELADGGVECAAPYWTPQRSLLDILPPFLAAMPSYIRSNFSDARIRAHVEEAGFPSDVVQQDREHPSLWCEYYSNTPPFYVDFTVFVYALLIDPQASSSFSPDPAASSALDPHRLPGSIRGTGLALPGLRAAYTPSSLARDAIGTFAHSGLIGKPLISVAGSKDMLIPPDFHAVGYAAAVAAARRAHLHRLYIVENATHLDTFTAFGYGLRAHLPFTWAAFDQLVRTVEQNDARGLGTTRNVTSPHQIT